MRQRKIVDPPRRSDCQVAENFQCMSCQVPIKICHMGNELSQLLCDNTIIILYSVPLL